MELGFHKTVTNKFFDKIHLNIFKYAKTKHGYSSRTKNTKEWFKWSFPDFITSAEWLPHSPDLNPMDYGL